MSSSKDKKKFLACIQTFHFEINLALDNLVKLVRHGVNRATI
ncbi:hypothetical protein [Nostoc sp.]